MHARFRYDSPMQSCITIRFYAELNDFLEPGSRQSAVRHVLDSPRSIKDLVQSLGVPHTEIDLILINGKPEDFSYLVRGGEHISVYPAFTSLAIDPVSRCQPRDALELRFILDTHLGKLASYLRMMGFDTLYQNNSSDPDLAETAGRDNRILLSCDRQLLMRNRVTYGYFVRSRNPRQQLDEINQRYNLAAQQRPFTRCMACNGELHTVTRDQVEAELMPGTLKHYDRFSRCLGCGKVYWKGSHYEKMKTLVDNINSNSGFTPEKIH